MSDRPEQQGVQVGEQAGAAAPAGAGKPAGTAGAAVAPKPAKSASGDRDPFIRAENEDDDGYDPYSDRPARREPLFERDPWA